MLVESIIIMTLVGIFLGIILYFVSKKFENKNKELDDEFIQQIFSVLPGINCGACGYPGCKAYAIAIKNGEKYDKCIPGKKETAEKIKQILDSYLNKNTK